MASRFEVVVDPDGRFHFQLRAPEGDVLLTSLAQASKIMIQNGVLNVRNAIKDPGRVLVHAGDGGHHATIQDRRGETLARTASVPSAGELDRLLERIREHGGAPLVDLTKRKPESAAG